MAYLYNPASSSFKTDLSGISEAGQGLGSAFSGIGSEMRAEDANQRAESSEGRLKELHPLNIKAKELGIESNEMGNEASKMKLDKMKFDMTPATEDDYMEAISDLNHAQADLNSLLIEDKTIPLEEKKVINANLDQYIRSLNNNNYTKSQVNNGAIEILSLINAYLKMPSERAKEELKKKLTKSQINKNYRAKESSEKPQTNLAGVKTMVKAARDAKVKKTESEKELEKFIKDNAYLVSKGKAGDPSVTDKLNDYFKKRKELSDKVKSEGGDVSKLESLENFYVDTYEKEYGSNPLKGSKPKDPSKASSPAPAPKTDINAILEKAAKRKGSPLTDSEKQTIIDSFK